ncbi:hypothetical protein A9G13_00675 [Gilliamella sp. wkB178]|uniref:hypothetical protein n=1 Tax=Gilliamella sp. wkB178 TaxID=3120259 RepID=UPI00080E9364|nr:hypothetical protein [Gilliamella apicola]OCG10287.1 hypothetical protein A9G13_00675 [Gilliamella apicola]
MPLLLLPYATTTQALSATTAQVIHGSQPYLTFDNGVTKVTTGDGLLGITISDGTTKITYTPADNTSTASNPIVLLKENQSFTDIGMLVPPTTDSITLNDLISAPYNYWGDDDGDGQGTNGVTASGNLSVRITDKNGETVSRNTVLSLCGEAPYKVELTATNGSLTTQYGLPNSSSFTGGRVTYYISPKPATPICVRYARPSLRREGTGNQPGPATIWNPDKGFLVQSTESSGYSRNFPTTGANNLYFDLDISGINGSTLTWPTVSQGGITATMTQSPDNANNIRVTLTGPVATGAQQDSTSPGRIARPSLPQTFVLVGKDSSNNEVVRYGFELQRWFVTRGVNVNTYPYHSSWCSSLGYRLPQVKDLTNAKCGVNRYFPCVNGIDGATPLSNNNNYQRNIGAGLFTEWGFMVNYNATAAGAGFGYFYYWTSDSDGSNQFTVVHPNFGNVEFNIPSLYNGVVCVYP